MGTILRVSFNMVFVFPQRKRSLQHDVLRIPVGLSRTWHPNRIVCRILKRWEPQVRWIVERLQGIKLNTSVKFHGLFLVPVEFTWSGFGWFSFSNGGNRPRELHSRLSLKVGTPKAICWLLGTGPLKLKRGSNSKLWQTAPMWVYWGEFLYGAAPLVGLKENPQRKPEIATRRPFRSGGEPGGAVRSI